MIMISTPTLGNMRIETAQRIAKLLEDDVVWPDAPVTQPIDAARNKAVELFMGMSSDPDDRLLFIDNDIVPPLGVVNRLLGHNKDIVGACCFVMTEDEGQYFPIPTSFLYDEFNELNVHYGSGLAKVDATGSGCIMVKRKVYETMTRPYEYTYRPNGEGYMGEDFNFCLKAADNGFDTWFDWGCVCDHIRPCSIKGVNDFLARKQNGRLI
jgi:hypothetical protein